MSKKIDFNKSVHELSEQYPEIIQIMVKLGFAEISKKAMLDSVGRVMTIPKGAKMKNIPMQDIIKAFMENGFEFEGEIPFDKISFNSASSEKKEIAKKKEYDSRTEQIKSYLKRLGAGEDLESVRADFVKNFNEVEAAEIMRAEQELLATGTPLNEVQKLCDVHSALFHGSTREEQIANAEKAVEASLNRGKLVLGKPKENKVKVEDKQDKDVNLVDVVGHPIHTFTAENKALEKLLDEAKKELAAGNDIGDLIQQIKDIAIHYAKKGDLLYPHLKVHYNISGPSNVMWTVDDEIRDELSKLSKTSDHNEEWITRAQFVLQRANEMIFKESNILLPLCTENFTEEEWIKIYQDSKDYDVCLGVEPQVWEKAEAKIENNDKTTGTIADEVVMPGGHMTIEQLTALLNTIPLEISFVDADNINRFFNEGSKVFKRPQMAIDREVFTCHPPKIEPMVRMIIDDFRNNRKDSVPVWMDKGGKTFLVTYMAVRDKNNKYLGTMEIVQDMGFAKEHFNKEK